MIDLLTATCAVCAKKFSFVDEFTVHPAGVVHARCWGRDDLYCPMCGEHRSEHDYACDDGFPDVTNGEGL